MAGSKTSFEVNMLITGVDAVNRGINKIQSSIKSFQKQLQKNDIQLTGQTKAAFTRLQNSVDQVRGTTVRLTSTQKEATESTKKFGEEAKRTHGKVGRLELGMFGAIKAGVGLGIVWQGINVVLTGTQKIFSDLAFASVELESTMVTMQLVAERTGRSFGEVMSIVNSEVDAFASRGPIMQSALRLMSTSLDNSQIQQFIQLVKDGSAAMGEQANVQLPLVASGFRRLNANVLDNIGVNVRLDKVQRQVAKNLGVSVQDLTNAQIEQGLFNEMLRQGEVFLGAYEEQVNTAKGAIARITTEWTKLTETVSNSEPIEQAGNALADMLENQKDFVIATKEASKGADEFGKIIFGIGSALGSLPVFGSLFADTVKGMTDLIQPGKDVVDNLALQGNSLDTINPLLEEYVDLVKSGMLTQKDLAEVQRTMGPLFDTMTKDIGLQNINVKELTNEMLMLTESYSEDEKILNTLAITTEEAAKRFATLKDEVTETWRRTNPLYDALKNKLDEVNVSYTELAETIHNNEVSVEEYRNKIQKADFAIADWRYTVKLLTDGWKDFQDEMDKIDFSKLDATDPLLTNLKILDELKEIDKELNFDNASDGLKNLTEQLRATQDNVEDLQRQLERKQAVLEIFPPETEDLLRDIQSELKSAQRELENAQNQLLKRVEPRLFQEYLKQESEARDKVNQLTKEEEDTKKKLEREIESLKLDLADQTNIMNRQQDVVDNLTSIIDSYNTKIEDSQRQNDLWRRKIIDLESEIDLARDQLEDFKDQIDDLNTDISAMAKAIDEATNKYKGFANLPDIVKNTRIHTVIDLDGISTNSLRYIYSTISNTMNSAIYDAMNSMNYSPNLNYCPIGGYQQGTEYVPRTGLAMLHQGEAVLTKQENQERQRANNTTNNNFQMAVTINAGNRSAQQLYRELNDIYQQELARRGASI